MNFIFVPSLQDAAIVRIASILYHRKEISIASSYTGILDWRKLEDRISKNLSPFLPKTISQKVAKCIRPLHKEVQSWRSDHFFIKKSLRKCHCTFISWKMNGTVNRDETARKIIAKANVSSKIRFIMACTYFLEDEIQDMWDSFSEKEKNRFNKENSNLAVLFWIKWLRKENKKHWIESVDEYFRTQAPEYTFIPERVSCFYHYLSSEGKKVYIEFLGVKAKVHSDDFQMIVNKMDEAECHEIFRLKHQDMLVACLSWPFQCLFIKMAKEAFGFMTAVQFVSLLFCLFRSYDDNEYENFYFFEELWEIIPADFKDDNEYENFHLFEELWEISPADFKDEAKSDAARRFLTARFSKHGIIVPYLEKIAIN